MCMCSEKVFMDNNYILLYTLPAIVLYNLLPLITCSMITVTIVYKFYFDYISSISSKCGLEVKNILHIIGFFFFYI